METGEMLDFLQDIDSIQLTDLCRGICSRSMISKVKNGERELNCICFIHMMKRLFVSPDRFFVLLDRCGYAYLKWLFDCQRLITAGNYGELENCLTASVLKDLYKAYGVVVKHDEAFFRYVIERELHHDLEAAYRQIKEAVEYMLLLDESEALLPGRYSTEEINRYMNYLELSVTLGYRSAMTAKGSFDQLLQMASAAERDPREEARLYPRIVCGTLYAIGKVYPPEIKMGMITQALATLRKIRECFDMAPLLAQLADTAEELKAPETKRCCNWYKAITLSYELGGISPEYNPYDSHDVNQQLYRIHEYLLRGRMAAQDKAGGRMTQEDASAEIMEASNYSRIETGYSDPSDYHFRRLATRLGLSSERYQGEITTPYITDFSLVTEVRRAILEDDPERFDRAYAVLNHHLDRHYKENRQFLDQVMVNRRLLAGMITEEKAIEEWIAALNHTIPYQADEVHVYSELEIETIFKIVRSKRRLGMMNDNDIKILESILVSEQSAYKYISSWNRVGLVKRLLAGIYQVAGNNEKSMDLCYHCLNEMMLDQDASLLIEILDILAENMVHTYPVKSERLMQIAYWIGDLYQEEGSKKAISSLIKRCFSKPIQDL